MSERWVDDFGQVLMVHEEGQCAGEFCTIHNPSDHPLSLMPQKWRAVHREGPHMTRICKHDIAHFDYDEPDKIMVNECIIWDGCDGCCQPKD